MLSRFGLNFLLFICFLGFLALPLIFLGLWLEPVVIEKLIDVSGLGKFEVLSLIVFSLLAAGLLSWFVARELAGAPRDENQLLAQQSQLFEAEIENTIGEMASGMAHELNQPLTAITGFIDGSINRLRDQGEVSKEILTALERASEQAYRAGKVIRKIRDFVQKAEGNFQSLDVNMIILQAVDILRPEMRRKMATLEVVLAKDLPKVKADRLQIQQVVLNLARNGLDAMSQNAAPKQKLVIRSYVTEGGQVAVAVEDNGPGVGDAESYELYEPFYTTKSGAMGLGLSICRTIIDLHEGELWYETGDPAGATFIFSLPIIKPLEEG